MNVIVSLFCINIYMQITTCFVIAFIFTLEIVCYVRYGTVGVMVQFISLIED